MALTARGQRFNSSSWRTGRHLIGAAASFISMALSVAGLRFVDGTLGISGRSPALSLAFHIIEYVIIAVAVSSVTLTVLADLIALVRSLMSARGRVRPEGTTSSADESSPD